MPPADRSGGLSKEKCSKSDLGNNSAAPQAPATPLLQPVIRQKTKDKKRHECRTDKRQKDKKTKLETNPRQPKNVVANLLKFVIVILQRSGGLKVDSS